MNIVTASRGTRGVYLIPEKKEYEASIKFIVALMCPVRDLRRQSHRRIHHSSLCGRYLPSSLFLFPSSSLPFLFIRPPCQVDSRSICLATDSNSSVHRRRSPLAKFPPRAIVVTRGCAIDRRGGGRLINRTLGTSPPFEFSRSGRRLTSVMSVVNLDNSLPSFVRAPSFPRSLTLLSPSLSRSVSFVVPARDLPLCLKR